MTSKIRADDPAELLSLVPYQLGFEPQNSVVVISLRGSSRRVGLMSRVDVTDLQGECGEGLARELVMRAARDGAQSLVVVVYTRRFQNSQDLDPAPIEAQAPKSLGRGPAADVIKRSDGRDASEVDLSSVIALQHVMRACAGQMPVVEVWNVSEGEFTHVAVANRCDPAARSASWAPAELVDLCTEHARALEDLKETKIAARMVFEGKSIVGSRAEIGVVHRATRRDRSSFQRCVTRISDEELRNPKSCAARQETLDWWLSCIDHTDEARDCGTRQSPHLRHEFIAELAEFMYLLTDVTFRDAILVSMTSLGSKGAQQFLSKAEAEAVQGSQYDLERSETTDDLARRAIAEIVDPSASKRPNPLVAERARQVLMEAISVSEERWHVGPRTLLALLSWWTGEGIVARRHLECVRNIDPDYGLAKLVSLALDHGLGPGWQRLS